MLRYVLYQIVVVNKSDCLSNGLIVLTIFETLMDLLFIVDLLINFRTVYINERTGEIIDTPTTVAYLYIFKGRFVADLVASIPFQFLSLVLDSTYLKAIKLLKLSRLLRISRLIALLKTSKTIKSSLKVFTTVSFLLLWIHWVNWLWYMTVDVDQTWLPAKSIDSGVTNLYTAGIMSEYLMIFYYAAQVIIGSDLIPSNEIEILWGIFIWVIGPVLMGIIIGQFSDLLNDITKRQRLANEELDIINNWMLQLRIPEDLQTRVLNYYDKIKGKHSTTIEQAFEFLNDSLKETIAWFLGKDAFNNLNIKMNISDNDSQERFYKTFSMSMSIEHYQEGDVIIKQGDFNDKIYFIIDI